MGPYYQTFSSCFFLQNLLVTVWLYDLLQGHIRSFPCPPKKISQIRLIPYSDVTSGQAACIHAFLCFKLSLLVWTRLFSKRVDLWVRNREKLLLCYTQVHYLCRQQPLGWCCFHLVGLSWYVCHLSKTLSRRHLLKREQAQRCFWFLCRNLCFCGGVFSTATLQQTITKLWRAELDPWIPANHLIM